MHTYHCPDCASKNIIVEVVEHLYLNNLQHYGYVTKPDHLDASVGCYDCGWNGKRKNVVERPTNV